MGISWQAALRMYAKKTGHFALYKKGSPEYEEVKKLQGSTEMSEEHAVKPRKSKKSMLPSATTVNVSGKIAGSKAPTDKGGAEYSQTSHGNFLLPPKADTTVIDPQAPGNIRKKRVAKAEKIPIAEKKGVQADGRTKKGEAQEFIVDDNTGASANITGMLAGQKERIEKSLKADRKTPKIVTVGNGEDKTIDGFKTDDPGAISGDKPFSFQALRNRLFA